MTFWIITPCSIISATPSKPVAKMMPPKKSKAARKAGEGDRLSVEEIRVEENGTDPNKKQPDQDPEEGDQPEVNIFKVEVLKSKRQRIQSPRELMMKTWLTDNFEARVGQELIIHDMYDEYVGSCASTGDFAFELYTFMKGVKELFPNGIAVKENSPHMSGIRVKKPKKERSPSNKPQADTFRIKMKDIIERALKELGGPKKKPLRFNVLKQYVTAKFPALRIELRPSFLLKALDRNVAAGHVELVRGIGKAGIYRLPRTEEEIQAEREEAKKKAEKKKPDDTTGKDNEEGDSEDAGTPEEGADVVKEETEPEDEAAGGRGRSRAAKTKAADTKTKPKAKKKKKRYSDKSYRSFIVHSDPQRVEDAFYMAMTYMVEPKEASVRRIFKYIAEYYKEGLTNDELRKTLESGLEKGYWEKASGSGMSGSYRLLFEAFDPTADDDMVGMVTNALTACTEPKSCSATLLKKYLVEYHPNFNISERPNVFKKAIQRAIDKNIIRQMTGIGATGSFILCEPFIPSPLVLAGNDNAEDYDSDDEAGVTRGARTATREPPAYAQGFSVEMFQDKYVPRPTKRHARVASAGEGVAPPPKRRASPTPRGEPVMSSKAKKRPAKKAAAGGGGGGGGGSKRGKAAAKQQEKKKDQSEEEREESEEEEKRESEEKQKEESEDEDAGHGRRGRGGSARQSKPSGTARGGSGGSGRAARKVAVSSYAEDDYESEGEEATPRKKTKRRGGSSRK